MSTKTAKTAKTTDATPAVETKAAEAPKVEKVVKLKLVKFKVEIDLKAPEGTKVAAIKSLIGALLRADAPKDAELELQSSFKQLSVKVLEVEPVAPIDVTAPAPGPVS